jgi:hypothetical protein
LHDFHIGKQAESETHTGGEITYCGILRAFGRVCSDYL